MKPPAPRRPAVPPSGSERPGSREQEALRAKAVSPAAGSAKPARAASPKDLARPIGQADAAAVLGPVSEPTDFLKRREERRRAKRSYFLKTALIALAGASMVAGLAWVLLFSSVFALDPGRVAVEGAQSGLISEEEARAAAAPYAGTPLPRVPTGAIASEIAKLPPVSTVEVKRHWPTGLDIALALREPAMIEGAEGAYRLVDSDGVSFAPAEPLPEGLPYVVLPEEDKRQDAAEDVLAVWAACSDSLKARIGWMSADGLTVSFTIDTGATVKWGTVDDSALKARVVEVLIAQRGASVYDVSAPAHPVTV